MRLETNNLAGDHEVATHTTTTGPSSPVISVFLSILINPRFPQFQWLFRKEKIVKCICMLFSESVFRSRNGQWLATLQSVAQDLAFYHICTTARKTEGKMTKTGTDVDMAFIERDFSN